MENLLKQSVLTLFKDDLKLGDNDICNECNPLYKSPLLPWIIGENFSAGKKGEKVLFVGKPHRGDDCGDDVEGAKILDGKNVVDDLWDKSWAYWSYTRKICENLYGSKDAKKFIALTNLVKCSNTDGYDKTTDRIFKKCVQEHQVIWKEIEIIKPETIVFFTFSFYKDQLKELPFALAGSVEEIHDCKHRVPCGQKKLGWWERKCKTAWSDSVRILITGHPQYKKKDEYISLITNWIRPQL